MLAWKRNIQQDDKQCERKTGDVAQHDCNTDDTAINDLIGDQEFLQAEGGDDGADKQDRIGFDVFNQSVLSGHEIPPRFNFTISVFWRHIENNLKIRDIIWYNTTRKMLKEKSYFENRRLSIWGGEKNG